MRRSNIRGLVTVTLRRRVPMLMATSVGMLTAAPAWAASLSGPITGWASGVPGYISMYEYVPAKLAANPPILVVSHYCGGNAAGVFGEAQGGGLVSAADQYGFVMIFPQTSNNCWDVGSTASLTHNGGGDTQAIAEMVTYAVSKHNADANRVYAVGTSSGAMMTEALLAIYPDVFKAGAEFSGVPAGCWAVNYSASNQWSGPCAGGQVTHTAQEWGDLIRAMYPGYSGHRPRIQLWHGTADGTINYNNQTEAIKEWTNVLGLSTNPTTTASVTLNSHAWTRQSWQNSCGFTVLDAWSEQSGPHGTDANLNATYVIPFLGLDKTGPDMGVSECSDGGTSGSSGASSTSGGPSGSSGATGSSGGPSGSSGASSGNGGSSGSSSASSGYGGSSGSGGASSGGSTSDGGSAFGPGDGGGTGSPGCACRMGPAEERSGGMVLTPIGAVVGILLRRRRRPRAAWNNFG
jgi:acetylxylan esterase